MFLIVLTFELIMNRHIENTKNLHITLDLYY
jgi:hypothetical protein